MHHIPVIITKEKRYLSAAEKQSERQLNEILKSSEELLQQCRLHRRPDVFQPPSIRVSDSMACKKLKKDEDKHLCRSAILELMQEEQRREEIRAQSLKRAKDDKMKKVLLESFSREAKLHNKRLLKMLDVYNPSVHVERKSPIKLLKLESLPPSPPRRRKGHKDMKKQIKTMEKLSSSPTKAKKRQKRHKSPEKMSQSALEHQRNLHRTFEEMAQEKSGSCEYENSLSSIVANNTVTVNELELVKKMQDH